MGDLSTPALLKVLKLTSISGAFLGIAAAAFWFVAIAGKPHVESLAEHIVRLEFFSWFGSYVFDFVSFLLTLALVLLLLAGLWIGILCSLFAAHYYSCSREVLRKNLGIDLFSDIAQEDADTVVCKS